MSGRLLRIALLTVALTGLCWAAVRGYANSQPVAIDAPAILQPTAGQLRRDAEESLRVLRSKLPQADAQAGDLVAYLQQLDATQRAVERALLAQPAQPKLLARLAGLRGETLTPREQITPLLHAATEMGGRSAPVAERVGQSWALLGESSAAGESLRAAVQADPERVQRLAPWLARHGYSVAEMLELLDPQREGFADVAPFARDSEQRRLLLDAMESAWPEEGLPGPRFLRAWSNTALELRAPQEVLRRLGQLESEQPALAGEIDFLRSRAWERDGDRVKAEQAARQAITLRPDWSRGWEHLGRLQFEAGRLDDGAESWRRALSVESAGAARPETLSRIYYRLAVLERDRGAGEQAALYLRRSYHFNRQHAPTLEAMTSLGLQPTEP